MRFIVLGVALVATAWFVIGIRQAADTSRAKSIVTSSARLSPARAQQAADALNGAGFLNPDKQVDVLRARLAHEQGDDARARQILKRVVASEPDYLDGWIQLARVSVHDRKTFFAAAFRIRQLVSHFAGSP